MSGAAIKVNLKEEPGVASDLAELVCSGYNAFSAAYRGDDSEPRDYQPWLASLQPRIPRHGLECWTAAAASLSAGSWPLLAPTDRRRHERRQGQPGTRRSI